MERELEMLIRDKVMEAERQPVAWRKEQVWMKVSAGIPQENRRRIYYYYAAAACLALFISASVLLLNKQHDNTNVITTRQTPASIKDANPDTMTPVPNTEVVDKPTARGKASKLVTPEKPHVEIAPLISEIHDSPTPPNTTVSLPPMVASTPEKKVERIKPVIGVFDDTEPRQEIVEHKKRKGLPWFKQKEEDKGPFEDQPQTIIARIH